MAVYSLQQYAKEEAEKKKKKKKKGSSIEDAISLKDYAYEHGEDIAPVRMTTSSKKEKEEKKERTWFDSGAFDDGYQFGDVTRTILGSVADVGEHLTSGVLGMGEKMFDAMTYLAPTMYMTQQAQAGRMLTQEDLNMVDQMRKDSQELIQKDLYDEQKIARNIITNPAKKIGIHADTQSVFGEKSDALVESAGQLGATIGLQAVGLPWWITTGATSFGAETENAFNQGATYEQAGGSALISAGAEILTEKLSGGINFGGKTLDDVLLKPLTDKISGKVTKRLVDIGIDAFGEGTEEVISGIFSNLGSSLYREENLSQILASEEAMDEYIESFIGGAVLGGGMSGVNAIVDAKRESKPTFTENEKKVVDKEIENRIAEKEADGKKLSQSEKTAIEKQVYNDLEKGYISIDTIESALGGEAYNQYKKLAEQEESLQKEFDELNKMKQGEMTGEQIDRRTELKQQLQELKKYSTKDILKQKASVEAEKLSVSNRLSESYNEKARRSQKFEADLTKYDAKQQAVIKKAQESGILNNTNRTHEFVDMVAKISAEKGVLFDFTNNERLKESGFAVEGKTVNGYVTKEGNISLNIDSNKALNTIVGHEITHVLEGTDLHKELVQAVKQYAITKGEYQTRFDSIAKLYKDVDGAVVENEITADLVGEYLFTDSEFINNLSTKQPNIFKKIYDEIKYLYKIATAGSKEARQLEKVKRAFDKAYKESGKSEKSAKYSLTADSDGKQLTDAQKEYFKDSKVVDENGNLKVMYHGTEKGGFHEFIGDFSDDGQSFFFTDNNATAKSYSGTHENYVPKTFRSAEDFNNFFAEINADDYEVREENGQFVLYEDGDEVATSDTANGIYEEFRDWTGLGYGSSNYKVYLNLKNPLIVDARRRNWDEVSSEFSQEIYDKYQTLTAEEKQTLTGLAEWDDFGIFRDEIRTAGEKVKQGRTDEDYLMNLASAYEKLGGEDFNLYRLFDIAFEEFSDEAIRENALKYLTTRDHSKRAKEQGYDGVIFKNIVDNGLYASGIERFTPSTVAIAFDSNQIKSVANESPTSAPDIRYSLSSVSPERISSNEMDIKYSLSHNSEIAKGQSDYVLKGKGHVTESELAEAHRVTNAMVDVMMKYSSILPEDKIGKVLTKNGSYDRSVENTTICVRTLAYNEFVDKVQEEIGRPLTQMESFLVSQKLYDIATEPQCLYCYVSLDRKSFNEMLLRYMDDRDSVIEKYNNSDKSAETVQQLYEEFLRGRKDTKPMKQRFNQWIRDVDNGVKLLTREDIATEERQSVIKAKGGELARQLTDVRKYAQSASWSKVQKDYVAYRDEILKLGERVVKNLNEHYGLRWYSFSDYSPAFIVENMQQITDASIRGLKGLSYTKDTDFAKVFAPSGMNINVSVFVNVDENGNFFIDEKQSANFEEAKKLREQYPNVGIVATVTNDDALRWAGSQEWSDVIIPFHIVRTGTDVAEYYKWLNYTSESADTIKDKNIWDAYLDSLNLKSENARKKVSKNIYPNEHMNDKATYLALCEKRGLTPRFDRFSGEDWYMKLVNETRLSAEQSVPLKPVYDLESAQVSFQKFIKKGGYEGGWYKEGVDVDAEARVVSSDVLAGKKANEVDYGRQDNFNPERLLGKRKTHRTHGRFSIGENQIAPVGNYHVYGKDIALETPQDTVQDVAPVGDKMSPVEEFFPSMTEEEANERDAYYGDRPYDDVPEEMEAPYYGEPESITPDNPFDARDIQEVGNRKTKAYMYENPEVKPYFQEEAEYMLGELQNSIKGERTFNDHLYYETAGEQGWFATKRETSEEIAYLLDNFKYTYKDIEKGLKAIIEDNGKENNAISKRIEFMLDERLREGHEDFMTGEHIPANQDYINLLVDKQIHEYSDEAYNEWLQTLADEEPVEVDMEEFAPIKEPEQKMSVSEEDTEVEEEVEEKEEIARILDTEPKTESDRNKRKWAIFKANVLDKGAVFEDIALKSKNRELMGKWNYTLYSESRAQRLIGSGNAENGVKSLNDIRAEVENSGLAKQFYEYIYHKHNVDRMRLAERYEDVPNKPVFGYEVTAEVSQEIVDQYEFAEPRFMDFAQDIYNYMTYLRQQLLDNSVISQETADLWSEMYPHYVPIRRVGDTGLNINVPLDTGRTGVNAPIKRATGGSSDILPLFDTMAMRTMQTYKATAKNSFGVELKNTIGSNKVSAKTSVDELIDSIDMQEKLLQEGTNGRKPTFTVFENGERVTFEITEDMYDALKPVSSSSMLSKTIEPLNVASNVHRGLLTEYNPVFLLTNAIKDTQDVLMNSQHSARTYLKIPEAHKQILTKGYWFNEYMENGGDQNTYFDNQTNTFKTENKGIKKLLDMPPFSTISTLNNYIEMIPRLAEYIASREAGRSIEVSMLDSARVTTNFRAGGDFTKFLNRNGATFLNASVQGAMQQVRNVREAKANGMKGWMNLATKFAIAGLPAFILNNFVWDDDEEYEELSDYVKQNYYVVGKYDDGKFIRIPKGRTVAVIQEAIRQISNAVTGNDEADLNSFLELAISNLAPNNPLESNILAPIVQAYKNETWYGEDLVPTRLQDLPASEQFDESTDKFSKWLGEKLDISPVKINYVLDQYSGGLGDVVLPMLTPEAESGADSLGEYFTAPLRSKFTTDSVLNNQNISDFYDTSDTLTMNAKKSNATAEDVLMNKYINSVKSEMNELYKEKREIQNSNLSNKIKYERVREIQRQLDELSKKALGTYENVTIDGDYARIGDRHYRLNDEGEWTKVNDKQLEKQEEVTNSLNVSEGDYWSEKEEYDFAYESPGKYSIAKAVGGYDSYKSYSKELSEFRADKDENGKTISGSAKAKKKEYIFNLDLEYGQQVILYRSLYDSKADKNEYNEDIVDYLNSRDDISWEDMKTILLELDFEVEDDGTIRW